MPENKEQKRTNLTRVLLPVLGGGGVGYGGLRSAVASVKKTKEFKQYDQYKNPGLSTKHSKWFKSQRGKMLRKAKWGGGVAGALLGALGGYGIARLIEAAKSRREGSNV